MHRNRLSIAASLVVLWIPAGGCQSDAGDEQAALQALLHDEPLQQVPPSAASTMGVSTAALAVAPADASSGSPIGAWNFEDCSSFSTNLFDSSFHNNTAFRAVNAACVPGAQGQGVAIAATEDIVYVPDQPTFRFEAGVTVGGWFKPVAVNGTRTLIRKRDRDTSSFALVLNGGKFQFVASFGSGRAASVIAPTRARAGVFQHVAGTYDGATLRLYIDGAEVTSFDVAGTIPIGAGPLLMANDGSERRFSGTIDNITFATHAMTAAEVLQLTCLPQQPTVTVPSELPSVPAGTPIAVDVALTNHDPPLGCAPLTFQLFTFQTGLLLDPRPGAPASSAPVASGETSHFTITATAPNSADPGARFDLGFSVFEQSAQFFTFESVPLVVAGATGCHVTTSHELMITDVSVVDDPVRTRFNGAWTFKRLMENMAASADDAPAMVEAVMTSFTTEQTINGFTVAPRPGMQKLILSQWPRTPDGKLDLAQAPLRLQAVVNRFDLRNLAHGDAGEGRFVFSFYDVDGFPLAATMILEYKLPAATDDDVLGWAQSFHALGALSFGEDYNAALQAITDRFAGRGARPGHPNDSAINTVRTNEIAFSGDDFIWQLRQFSLSATSGRLEPATVDLTPDRSFNNSDTLAAYINANQDAIIAETHVVPAVFNGQSFAAGAIFNDLHTWFAPGVDSEARHHFALNTCNGCHSLDENNVFFLQITPRALGGEVLLSPFLTGTIIADPVTGAPRTLDDLGRRKLDLEPIVCPGQGARATTTLRTGISRVH
jgi:Concanavalin A-like lectin/glucanases superfamily